MNKRNFVCALILAGLFLSVIGCGADLFLNTISSSGDTKSQLSKVFYRVPGVGTVRTEVLNPDGSGNWFINFTTELNAVDYGSNNQSDVSDQILPMLPGITWTDSVSVLDSTESLVSTFTLQSKVEPGFMLDDEMWYPLRVGSNIDFIGTNREDGFWSISTLRTSDLDSIVTVGDPFLSAKYPVTLGTSFSSEPGTFIVVGSEMVSVTVPAGTFMAIEYRKYITLQE